MLFRPSVPDHGTLYFCRRVFGDGQTGLDRRQHGDATRMAKLQRAASVHRMKQIFNGDTIGLALTEESNQPGVNVEKLFRKGRRGWCSNHSARHDAMARTVGFHAAVTGAVGTGVDAEDLHASEASISFSSMSKFDHT